MKSLHSILLCEVAQEVSSGYDYVKSQFDDSPSSPDDKDLTYVFEANIDADQIPVEVIPIE